jgi:tetratricopeptide (TPR) repeat protein
MAIGKARPLVVARLFEAALLMVLRERELALDASASLARAMALSLELPPALEADRYLTIVEAVPNDDSGWPRRESEAFRRERVGFVPEISGEIAWLETAALRQPVRQYVALAIDCAYPTRPRSSNAPLRPLNPAAPPAPPPPGLPPGVRLAPPAPAPVWPRAVAADAAPLVVHRRALCRDQTPEVMESIRAKVPRFVETSPYLARAAMAFEAAGGAPVGQRPDRAKPKPRELLDEAFARFPTSPLVTYLDGSFNQRRGDCRAALRFYDATLAFKPQHEDALLGRTMCLAYLKRFDEAIQAATTMVELNTDNVAYAFYWRAWIRHEQQQLEPARTDINQAKLRDSTAEILNLAGIIEYEQNDLAIARGDLQMAKRAVRGNGNCVAMWYLGLVGIKEEHWLESAGNFNDSMGCYERNVKEDQDGLTAVSAREDLEPDYRAQQIAGFEAAIKEDRSRQYTAAFNAANEYAQGGNVVKARELLDIAAKEPALADRVGQLRKIIGG